jgi:hypothetical protein
MNKDTPALYFVAEAEFRATWNSVLLLEFSPKPNIWI